MIKPYHTQRFVTDTFMLIMIIMKAYIALRALYIGIGVYTK